MHPKSTLTRPCSWWVVHRVCTHAMRTHRCAYSSASYLSFLSPMYCVYIEIDRLNNLSHHLNVRVFIEYAHNLYLMTLATMHTISTLLPVCLGSSFPAWYHFSSFYFFFLLKKAFLLVGFIFNWISSLLNVRQSCLTFFFFLFIFFFFSCYWKFKFNLRCTPNYCQISFRPLQLRHGLA